MADYKSIFTGGEIDGRLTAVSQLQAAITALETAISAKYTKPSAGIPASDMDANVQDALAKAQTAVQSLTDYYTKQQVDAISAAIAATVNSTSAETAASLPTASESTLGKIYYIGPDSDGYYDRYVTSYDGAAYSWIPLGNTQMDLADYATKAEVMAMDETETEVDLSGYANRNYIINATTGKYGSATTYYHILVPVYPGQKYRIVPGSNNAQIAWLTTDADATSGGTPAYAPGTELVVLETGKSYDVTVPPNAGWMYVRRGQSPFPDTPESISLISGRLRKVGDAAAYRNVAVDRYSRSWYYVAATGKWTTSKAYFHRNVPVTAGEKYLIVAPENFYLRFSFLSADSVTAGADAPIVGSVIRYQVPAGQAWKVTIPTGCTHVSIYAGGTTADILPQIFAQIIPVETKNALPLVAVRTVKLDMELGFITSGGTLDLTASNSTSQNNTLYSRQRLFLNLRGGDVINSIDVGQYDTVRMFCYDSKFSLLGYSTIIPQDVEIPAGTAWVKLDVKTTTVMVNNTGPLTMSVLHEGPIEFAKNFVTLNTGTPIVFEVKRPFDDRGNLAGSDYLGNPERIWDTGILYLPSNYDPAGAPVPLVIFCHGTGGYVFGNSGPQYPAFLNFLAHNGFAVALASGETSYFKTSFYGAQVSGLQDSKSNPLLYACYASLYDYLVRDFNISKEGVYLLSKSAGGLAAAFLAHYQPFKVRAAAHLAPALVMGGQSFRVTNKTQMDWWLQRLGCAMTIESVGLTPADRANILAHGDLLIGFDALFLGTEIDYKATLQLMYSIDPSGASSSETIAAAYAANPQLMAVFDNAAKRPDAPTKIWIAQDDDEVPYMWAEKFRDMTRRGNGICELRTMPNNSGKHHVTDIGNGAPHTNYLCDDGTVADIPVAFAEACDWFKEW